MPLFLAFLLLCTAGTLASPRINEVQSTNTSLPDAYGQLMDWVEIHNPTANPVDLADHYLSDSNSNKLKFRFPATILAPAPTSSFGAANPTSSPLPAPTPPANSGRTISTSAPAANPSSSPRRRGNRRASSDETLHPRRSTHSRLRPPQSRKPRPARARAHPRIESPARLSGVKRHEPNAPRRLRNL